MSSVLWTPSRMLFQCMSQPFPATVICFRTAWSAQLTPASCSSQLQSSSGSLQWLLARLLHRLAEGTAGLQCPVPTCMQSKSLKKSCQMKITLSSDDLPKNELHMHGGVADAIWQQAVQRQPQGTLKMLHTAQNEPWKPLAGWADAWAPTCMAFLGALDPM